MNKLQRIFLITTIVLSVVIFGLAIAKKTKLIDKVIPQKLEDLPFGDDLFPEDEELPQLPPDKNSPVDART